jgi:methyl-accepting chemotaxis protein
MLRQKFFLVLGVVIALLVAMAATAILLLHGILRDLDAASEMATATSDVVFDLRSDLAANDAELRTGDRSRLRLVPLAHHLDRLHTLPIMADPGLQSLLSELRDRLLAVEMSVDGGGSSEQWRDGWRSAAAALAALDALDDRAGAMLEEQRRQTTVKFRLVALILGLLFVLVINASVMVLSRMVSMVVKPVDRLVEASRRLAREEFDHRVELHRADEFEELAQAYNSLAAQLQQNEQRKIETLHHVACMLNHELNNAIAIIELQLALLSRATRGDGAQAQRLREIHETLERISRTVQALARVRRIVLADYTPGSAVRMLDLEQSLEENTVAAAKSEP